jgi:tetratricopeptide (TPR) repeat protein
MKVIVKVITILSLLVSIDTSAQKIDSLMLVLNNSEGAERVIVLYELGYEYLDLDNRKARDLGNEGYTIAQSLNDTLSIIKSGRVLATALRKLGSLDSAIFIYEQIVPMARIKNPGKELQILLNSLGVSYQLQARYDEALHSFFGSLYLRKEDAEKHIVLNNIGAIYYKLKDYRKALEYFILCAAIKRRINDSYDLEITLLNISLSYAYINEFGKGMLYADSALSICGDNCSNVIKKSAGFSQGVIFLGLGQIKRAETYFLYSLKIARTTEDHRYILDNIDYLSQIYIQQNKLASALQYLREAEKIINNGASLNLELIKIYSRFFEVYKKQGDLKQVAYYQEKYIQLKDTIYNEALTTNLMKIEANHLQRENTARIEAQKRVIALTEKDIANQRLLNILTGAIAVFFLLAIILLFKLNLQKGGLINCWI